MHRDAVVHGVRHAGELLVLGRLDAKRRASVLLAGGEHVDAEALGLAHHPERARAVGRSRRAAAAGRARASRPRWRSSRPARPDPVAVTTVTPVAKWPMTARKRSGSTGCSGMRAADCSVCCAAVMPRRLVVAARRSPPPPLVAACGEEGIELSKDDPDYEGAKIFEQRCSGCHTLDGGRHAGLGASRRTTASTRTARTSTSARRTKDQVLYAIRNGGFSSGPMPQNIVVGEDAEEVADFLAKYSGSDGEPPEPDAAPDCRR